MNDILHKNKPIGDMRRKIAMGGVWVVAGKVVMAMLTLGTNAVLARLLTPEELGSYFLTLSVILFLSTIGKLGIDQAALRFISEANAQPTLSSSVHKIVTKSLIISSIVLLALAINWETWLGQFIGKTILKSDLLSGTSLLLIFWFSAIAYQGILAEIFRGLNDYRLATSFGGLVSGFFLFFSLFIAWYLYGTLHLENVVALSALTSATGVCLAYFFLQKQLHAIRINDVHVTYFEMLNVGWSLCLSSIMFVLIAQLGTLILGAWKTGAEVAMYGAAMRLVTLFTMPTIIVNSILPPLVAGLFSTNDTPKAEFVVRSMTALLALPVSLMMLVIAIYGGDLLSFVYGEHYRDAYKLVLVACLGQMIYMLSGPGALVLSMTGHHYHLLLINLGCGAFMLALMTLVVDAYGAIGIVTSYSLVVSLQGLIVWVVVKKSAGITTHPSFRHMQNGLHFAMSRIKTKS